MSSIHQIGSELLLTVHEPTLEDQLVELAKSRGTRVAVLGEQSHLFDESSTLMVAVENRRLGLRLVVPRTLAARYGLTAE